MEFDTSELDDLAADLEAMGTHIRRKVRPVVSKAGVNIKNQMQSEASRSRHFEIGPSISYDLTEATNAVEIEVGPTKQRRAGRLANIAYFGGVNGGGGTLPDPEGALEAEAPNVMEHLADAVIEDF